MSIRIRLTIIYGSLLAVTLVLLGSVMYVMVERATRDVLEDTLRSKGQSLVSNDQVDPGATVPVPGTWLQTRTTDGAVIARSSTLLAASLPLSTDGRQRALDGQDVFEVASVDGTQMLVFSTMVEQPGRAPVILQIGRSLEGVAQTVETLRAVLIVGGGIGTLAALAIGWAVAGATLRPIARITQTADAIATSRDLSRRVEHDGPRDEIGRMVETLNRMLATNEEAYLRVELALDAQQRFVGDASHELRSPLTTLRGNIRLLRRQPPIAEDERVAILEDMTREAQRMSRLVHNLLRLARSDADQHVQCAVVPLAPLFESVARVARRDGRTVEVGDPGAIAIRADRDATEQVLLNLLENAVKFTPPDGTIRLRAESNRSSVTISVEDSGCGIPAAVVDRIFDRFFTATSGRANAGSGLGLAIVRSLVEAQHGTIAVKSVEGRGSTFAVTLPQAGEERSAAQSIGPATRDLVTSEA